MAIPTLTYRPGTPGHVVHVGRLIASRMLLQANSGGGKSRALRQMLEETFGVVPHLVIDPEGEFASLRERFPYVLAAKQGGDVVASAKTARLLCRRLVELGASAVLDLYELPLHERREFVRLFLTEMLALPRSLWKPYLVVIDEMHHFAPERGSGEAQSTEAVISLATLGRKRGFALVGATQRISKVHKDAAAELLNKMIGRTGLDVDVKRAGDELGMDKEARAALRSLVPGEFFVYGPAMSPTITHVRTGAVTTTHPEAGSIGAAAPPAPAKVKAILSQLADLPQEAEQEARTVADLQRQVGELQRKLRQAEKGAPSIDRAEVDRQIAAAVEKARAGWTRELGRLVQRDLMSLGRAIEGMHLLVEKAHTAATESVVPAFLALTRTLHTKEVPHAAVMETSTQARGDVQLDTQKGTGANSRVDSTRGQQSRSTTGPRVTPSPSAAPAEGVTPGGQRILNALAELHAIGVEAPSRKQLGMYAGYNLTGGTGAQHIADLVAAGYVAKPSAGAVSLTDAGHAIADGGGLPRTLREVHERVLAKLSDGQRRIAAHLISIHPDAISRAELGAAVGYNLTGGTGAQHVADLITVGAAERAGTGKVVASDLLFPEGLR